MRRQVSVLKPDAEETLVRTVLKTDLIRRLNGAFAIGPRTLSHRYRTWADKYAVTLYTLESVRDHAAAQVTTYLKDLGYA
jgi:type I restriction enzyme M protein